MSSTALLYCEIMCQVFVFLWLWLRLSIRHSKLLRDMLADVVSGDQHLLLIGNQGVGKNKLADRALQLLNTEREYMQLHRWVSSWQNNIDMYVVDDGLMSRISEHAATLRSSH